MHPSCAWPQSPVSEASQHPARRLEVYYALINPSPPKSEYLLVVTPISALGRLHCELTGPVLPGRVDLNCPVDSVTSLEQARIYTVRFLDGA